LMDFILKTAKRKLPLHENSFVKATAPLKGLRQVSKYCHDQFCDRKIK